jgi:HK97 family phage portal protein
MGIARDWARLFYWSQTGDPAARPPEVEAAVTSSRATLAGMGAASAGGSGISTPGGGPESDFWYEPLGRPGGGPVNEDVALSIGAVMCCVRLLCDTTASLPLPVYKRLSKGERQRDDENGWAKLLRRPNLGQTDWDWRAQQMGWLALRGASYSRIVGGNGRGLPNGELRPLVLDRLSQFLQPDGSIFYRYHHPTGGIEDLVQDEVLAFRGLTLDGVRPVSVVKYAADSMYMAKAMAEHGTALFNNSAQPGGLLTYDGVLDEPMRNNVRRAWELTHGGPRNAGKIAVLEDGMKWQQVGLTSEDAEFLASRKFQVNEIARWFRIPPHMVGDLERATFANIEHQSIEFVVYCLRPWLTMMETAINTHLIGDSQYFAEFLIDGLLRGDSATRTAVYRSGLNDGWMTPNEVRRLENLPRSDDPEADKLRSPLNMTSGDRGPDQGQQDQNRPVDRKGNGQPQRPDPGKAERLLESAQARILGKEHKTLERLAKEASNGNFALHARAFYGTEMPPFVMRAIGCSRDRAEEYCDEQCADVLDARDKGLLTAVLHRWPATPPAPTVRLIDEARSELQ